MASVQARFHLCSLKLQLEILEVFLYAPSDRPPWSLQLCRGGTALTPSSALNPTENSEKEALSVIF